MAGVFHLLVNRSDGVLHVGPVQHGGRPLLAQKRSVAVLRGWRPIGSRFQLLGLVADRTELSAVRPAGRDASPSLKIRWRRVALLRRLALSCGSTM